MNDPVKRSHKPVTLSLQRTWDHSDPFQSREGWEETGLSLLNPSGPRQLEYGEWKGRYEMKRPGARPGFESSSAHA